jgi:hypothetical protein
LGSSRFVLATGRVRPTGGQDAQKGIDRAIDFKTLLKTTARVATDRFAFR